MTGTKKHKVQLIPYCLEVLKQKGVDDFPTLFPGESRVIYRNEIITVVLTNKTNEQTFLTCRYFDSDTHKVLFATEELL